MDTVETQMLSLIMSIFFLVVSIIHVFISRLQSKWIFVLFSLGWLAEIVFYVYILYFGGDGHSFSAGLRSFQNIIFGGWMVLTLFEKISVMDFYKKIKTRMKHGN